MKFAKYIIAFAMFTLFAGCSAGLEPLGNKLTGKVIYRGEWMPADSIKDLRVVAFKNYPPGDIINEVITGQAIFSESLLPYFADSAYFSIEIPETPVTYKYIAVARQYGSLFEWVAMGVYTNDYQTFEPLPVTISSGEVENINIIVDFANTPPQPF